MQAETVKFSLVFLTGITTQKIKCWLNLIQSLLELRVILFYLFLNFKFFKTNLDYSFICYKII